MDNITRLYQQLRFFLISPERPSEYFEELQNKLQGIFDLKEVVEYKTAVAIDEYSPAQFQHLTSSMKRAFVEGYLLAQMEQHRKDIRHLYNMYRETECQTKTKEDVKNY